MQCWMERERKRAISNNGILLEYPCSLERFNISNVCVFIIERRTIKSFEGFMRIFYLRYVRKTAWCHCFLLSEFGLRSIETKWHTYIHEINSNCMQPFCFQNREHREIRGYYEKIEAKDLIFFIIKYVVQRHRVCRSD